MKKTAIAGTIAWAAMSAGAAHAQSSVTLYGIIDTGIAYIHDSAGQASQWRMQTSNISGAQWGLKGSEELGGGLSAIFTLENGFDSGNGQTGFGGRQFGRQAFVGLSSATAGTLTLGRQYDPLTDLLQPLTADVFGGWFATPGDVDNYDDSARFSNALKWVSPTWGGVTVEGLYALGGVAGATGSGQSWSVAASYAGQSFNLAGGYLHIDKGNPAALARGTSTADSLFNSPVNAAYASARSVNIARTGGNVSIGAFTVGAAYSYSRYEPDAASAFTDAQKYHNASVFGIWSVAPDFQVVAAYNYTRALGDSSAKYHQVNAGVDYLLSKRTDVYALAGYQHALGQNGQGAAEASIGSFGFAAGKSTQEMAAIGVRHRF
jgi:predicted porin